MKRFCMVRRIRYIRLLLALYLFALILSPKPAAATDPLPGDACQAGENAINTFQWNSTGDNGTPPAAGVTNAIFCIGNVRKSIMTLQAATGNVGIGITNPSALLHVGTNSSDSSTAPTSVGASAFYFGVGNQEYQANSYRLIGFGYKKPENTYFPSYIGYQEINAGGQTYGDLIFGTRSVTTDSAPTERMRISNSGNVGIGTASPQATLDVNGYMRLAKYSAQPVACAAGNDGAIALTDVYTICICKGGSTSWVQSKDGSTACSW